MFRHHFVNHRTHILCTAVLASVFAGCYIREDDDGGSGYYDDPPVYEEQPETVFIDEGATLEAEPGVGAGVFVEYLGFGEWNVWATCDTYINGFSCTHDVFIRGDGLKRGEETELEAGDSVQEDGFESLHLAFATDFDVDGATFSTVQDAPILVEVWLDGLPDQRLVFWVDGGFVIEGMPTNPTFFAP